MTHSNFYSGSTISDLHPHYGLLFVVFSLNYNELYQIRPQSSGSRIYDGRVFERQVIEVKRKRNSQMTEKPDPILVAARLVFTSQRSPRDSPKSHKKNWRVPSQNHSSVPTYYSSMPSYVQQCKLYHSICFTFLSSTRVVPSPFGFELILAIFLIALELSCFLVFFLVNPWNCSSK